MATRELRELMMAEKTRAPAVLRRPVKPYACQHACHSEAGHSGHSFCLWGPHVCWI